MHNERPKNTIAKLQTKFRQNMFLSVQSNGLCTWWCFLCKKGNKKPAKKSLVAGVTGENNMIIAKNNFGLQI